MKLPDNATTPGRRSTSIISPTPLNPGSGPADGTGAYVDLGHNVTANSQH